MSDFEEKQYSKEEIAREMQSRPHIFVRLQENALVVAKSLRNNYFSNTTEFVKKLREVAQQASAGKRKPIINIESVRHVTWNDCQQEVVSFIDGGVGKVEFSGQSPILVRVGSYCVKTGESDLAQREQFGHYPIIMGDLEGGSRDRNDFTDIVRITSEILGGLSTLKRNKDLRVLLFHGPLVYTVWHYQGHAPFTEKDIDLFLDNYAADLKGSEDLKEEFLERAGREIYPKITKRYKELIERRLFEPLAWMSFLYSKIIEEAKSRNPVPIIAGIVERGRLNEFNRTVLLARVFDKLHENGKGDWFNDTFGRTDLNDAESLVNRLGYSDDILLSMILEPGDYSEPWMISKYKGFSKGEIFLPGESHETIIDWKPLSPHSSIGFPSIKGFYLSVSNTNYPIRIEVFNELENQVYEAASRIFLYSKLLPGYGFPVGLDIADKHAKIPKWMTDAYDKIIRHSLGVSLQTGEIGDEEMRRILIQSIYMNQRDWLFRPEAN